MFTCYVYMEKRIIFTKNIYTDDFKKKHLRCVHHHFTKDWEKCTIYMAHHFILSSLGKNYQNLGIDI